MGRRTVFITYAWVGFGVVGPKPESAIEVPLGMPPPTGLLWGLSKQGSDGAPCGPRRWQAQWETSSPCCSTATRGAQRRRRSTSQTSPSAASSRARHCSPRTRVTWSCQRRSWTRCLRSTGCSPRCGRRGRGLGWQGMGWWEAHVAFHFCWWPMFLL